MRITDCHVHVTGDVASADLLRQMDAIGVDRVLLMSEDDRVSLMETRRKLLRTKKLLDADPERIGGLAWVNPAIPGMAGLAEEALTEMGYVGIKIIPDHWYAYEERLEPFWEAMNRLGASILFHTGILFYYDDGSRFCRPLWLEKLLHYPNIRFAMAHNSWPWTEECLAVMGRMRDAAHIGGWPWQSYIDITPGTPRRMRKRVLEDAIALCGVERLMFGSDSELPRHGLENLRVNLELDLALFDELGLSDEEKERILSGTADEVFSRTH